MANSVEEKWQNEWKVNHVFEPKLDSSKRKFMLTVPWPYTSGPLHVGHGRTYTIGDIISRYLRARRYNVLFPMGFHESGTPVIAIAQKIKQGDQATISQYREYLAQYSEKDAEARLKSFTELENIADYFSNAIIHDFTKMGYSIDWTRRFTSAEPMYQKFVSWQFRKLNGLGYLSRGDYPILYSIEDQNPVGEDDIKDGDTDKVSIEDFVGVKFKGKEFSLAAGTLRPETIYGVTNLWISPNGVYSLISLDGDSVVISEEAEQKLKFQGLSVKHIRRVTREEILSVEYTVPLAGNKIRAYQNEFVDPDNATGIVYSVPGHSVMDYVALRAMHLDLDPKIVIRVPDDSDSSVSNLVKKLKIEGPDDKDRINEATQILYRDEFYSGIMNSDSGILSGIKVSEAREVITSALAKDGNVFSIYETSRDAVTRGGSKVIVAVVKDQWFIDYSKPEWKNAAHDLVNSMSFYPDYMKRIFNDTIDWLKQRPCARTRGLGTRLPMDEKWVIESLSDSTLYPAVYTNSQELRNMLEDGIDLNQELLESIFGDDSGAESHETTLTKAAREQLNYWYGVDLRITSFPHISNHLAFYIMNHAAIFPPGKMPGGIMISGVVTSGGAKIGKSKGNAVSLVEVVERHSADIFRLSVAVGADTSSELDWNEEFVTLQKKKIEQFTELMESFTEEKRPLSYIERWLVSSFYQRLERFLKDMDIYNIRQGYISILHEFMNDLKYMDKRGGSVNAVLSIVIRHWLIALAPCIPHLCEEYWHRYVKDSFVSMEVMPEVPSDFPDLNVLASEEYTSNVVDDIRQIMKATGISPKKISIGVSGETMNEMLEKLASGKFESIPGKYKGLIPEYMKIKRVLKQVEVDELTSLETNREYLSDIFECRVEIQESEISMKGKNAWPGRPVITLE